MFIINNTKDDVATTTDTTPVTVGDTPYDTYINALNIMRRNRAKRTRGI